MRLLKEKLAQWFFNISKFSNELLEDLNKLDDWPEKVKLMQKNWIGKSIGCEIDFETSESKNLISKYLQLVPILYLEPLLSLSLLIILSARNLKMRKLL